MLLSCHRNLRITCNVSNSFAILVPSCFTGEKSVIFGNVSNRRVEHDVAMLVPFIEHLENCVNVVLVRSVRHGLQENACKSYMDASSILIS